jgi:hypothetical protein
LLPRDVLSGSFYEGSRGKQVSVGRPSRHLSERSSALCDDRSCEAPRFPSGCESQSPTSLAWSALGVDARYVTLLGSGIVLFERNDDFDKAVGRSHVRLWQTQSQSLLNDKHEAAADSVDDVEFLEPSYEERIPSY